MNKVILAGRLTRDPEVRYTQSGKAVASFTLAVDRRFGRKNAEANGQPTADFIPIVVWERLAEGCGNNLIKGSQVLVEGRMQVRSYDAQDGSKRYVTEVVANEVEFMGSRPQREGGAPMQQGGYQQSAAPQQQAPQANNSFGPSIPDEEIPF